MRKLLLAVAVLATIALPVSVAVADPPPGGPPGQGECEHGNSGQECKPDPQPDHGKDCDEHGPFEGGVNEDHCLATTTTTTVTTTATTTTASSTTQTPTTTTATVTTTETTSPPPTSPGTRTATSPVSTTPPPVTVKNPNPPSNGPSSGGPNGHALGGELAYTGFPLTFVLALIAVGFLGAGLALFGFGRRS